MGIARQRQSHTATLALLCLGVAWAGCGQEAKLIRETPSGGTVAFPFSTEGDRLSSQARSEALTLMEGKCGKTFKILREGEVPRVSATADRAWRGQMSGDRLWGMEFTCQ